MIPRPTRSTRTDTRVPHTTLFRSTGEIYIEAGDEVSAENLEKMDADGIDTLVLLDIDHNNTGPWIRNTLKADKAEDRDQDLPANNRVILPGEPPPTQTAEAVLGGMFFDVQRKASSRGGRVNPHQRH